MNLTRLILPIVCLFGFMPLAEAADKPLKIKVSKVSAAKSRDREKLFTDWMTMNELVRLNDTKEKTGEYMIYYEYDEGKDKYRGLHSKLTRVNGYWWRTVSGEKAMEDEVKTYKGRGYEPLFIVLEGNFYRMLFLKPSELAAAQKVLKDLGVEPPVVK